MFQTPEKDSPEKKKPFIHETITGSGKQNRQIGRKVLLTVGLAAVFGVTASLTFVVAQPFWEARFGETETSENITIARDDITEAPVSTESETSRETESETSRETESETGTQPAEESRSERETGSSDDWENRVQAMINNDLADLNDYKSMYNALNNITIRANKSLVTVTASSTDTDWFDQPFSSEQETCGIIVGKTAKEYLILVDADLLDGVDNLNVTFGIYGTGSAYLKQSDGILDLAVIGVPLDTLSNGVDFLCESEYFRDGYDASPDADGYCDGGERPRDADQFRRRIDRVVDGEVRSEVDGRYAVGAVYFRYQADSGEAF